MYGVLGIPRTDTIAVGDSMNDLEMLQFAGKSYAMSDAAPGLSEYTTDVTDSVEDVLRDFLNKL